MKKFLSIKKEVKTALKKNKPVVALESTIISHGMPYPQNVETALQVEEIVRKNGAVPATIAVMDGKLKAGLTKSEIEQLGKTGLDAVKTSRRDIPFALAQKADGATTVAATMIIAALAGIEVFATGGIGGVHRGAEKSFDISADLEELARTNVAVVCAGAKSILDIGLTLEYLETRGVPVIGYGTKELPAFYTSKSGFFADYRIDTAKEAAEAIYIKNRIKLKGGIVIANPIPEEYEMDPDRINSIIQRAIEEAEEKGIQGRDVTPYLLDRVQQLTGGDSLKSNIQLMYNNAKVASKIAVELGKLK